MDPNTRGNILVLSLFGAMGLYLASTWNPPFKDVSKKNTEESIDHAVMTDIEFLSTRYEYETVSDTVQYFSSQKGKKWSLKNYDLRSCIAVKAKYDSDGVRDIIFENVDSLYCQSIPYIEQCVPKTFLIFDYKSCPEVPEYYPLKEDVP